MRYQPKARDFPAQWDNFSSIEHERIEDGSRTVHVKDDEPIDSGLLDAQGNRLYRFPEKLPMGFRP